MWITTTFFDVQLNDGGNAVGVSSYGAHQPEIPLTQLTNDLQTAHNALVTEVKGLAVGSEDAGMPPVFLTDTNDLSSYFNRFGAYESVIATPAPPPPAQSGR